MSLLFDNGDNWFDSDTIYDLDEVGLKLIILFDTAVDTADTTSPSKEMAAALSDTATVADTLTDADRGKQRDIDFVSRTTVYF